MAKTKLSFKPQVMDLELYAGDGCGFKFTAKDSAGEALPITGSVKAQIRIEREAEDPPAGEFDIDMAEALDGIILVSITGEASHDLLVDGEMFEGVWDLEWTAEDAEPKTLVQGDVRCLPDVTH